MDFFSCAGIAKRGTRTSCGLQRKKLRTSKKKRGPTIILRMISIKKSWMFVKGEGAKSDKMNNKEAQNSVVHKVLPSIYFLSSNTIKPTELENR